MKRWICVLGLISLGGTLCRGNTTYTVTITVVEDEMDNLIFQGDTLSWDHLAGFANGGVCATVNPSGGCATTGHVSEIDYAGNTVNPNNPLILVSGTDSSNATLDFNAGWYNGMQGFACTSDGSAGAAAVLPCPFTPPAGFDFVLPYSLNALIGPVTLTVLECAGQAGSTCPGSVILGTRDPTPTLTQPTGGNGETATVVLNDEPDSGTHTFEFELAWTVTPEPGTAALGGLGLIALALVARHRRRSMTSYSSR